LGGRVEPCKGAHGHWKTITLVAGLRHDAIVAPFVMDGRILFLTYVERCVAATLGRGDVVIMDNLPTHKIADVTEAIEAADGMAIVLPAYSPNESSANSRHCYATPQNR
jgi:DDE superfamily endonuclease